MLKKDWFSSLIRGHFLHCTAAKYLVDDEFVNAIWQRPAVLLHQRDERVAEELLLPLVFGCGTTITIFGCKTSVSSQAKSNKGKKK